MRIANELMPQALDAILAEKLITHDELVAAGALSASKPTGDARG